MKLSFLEHLPPTETTVKSYIKGKGAIFTEEEQEIYLYQFLQFLFCALLRGWKVFFTDCRETRRSYAVVFPLIQPDHITKR